MITWLKYWGQLLLIPLYWCARLFPRDKKIWLFGSTFGRRYADNPRYFYQFCNKYAKKSGLRFIWISHETQLVNHLRNNGCEAYRYHSLKGIWYALRGGVYLYDNYSKDINFWQSAGAIKVNMWHGIPLKKIQADNKHDKFRHPKNIWERWKFFPRNISDEKPSDFVLTTSKNLEKIFASAFRTKNILVCGYPRTDYLISEEIENLLLPKEQQEMDAVEKFIKEDSKANTETGDDDKNFKNAKIVYYMPTFRDSETKFFDVMDLEQFQKYLEEENIIFCVKLHPKSKLKQEFENIEKKGFKNLLIIDADSDPYVLLKVTDVLVTDYSSVYFDFLLLDRPIVFFDYDREEYLAQSRELYFEYEEMTPGEKVETAEGLANAIHSACHPSKEYSTKYTEQRKRVRERVFDTPMELASPKLVEEIQRIVND